MNNSSDSIFLMPLTALNPLVQDIEAWISLPALYEGAENPLAKQKRKAWGDLMTRWDEAVALLEEEDGSPSRPLEHILSTLLKKWVEMSRPQKIFHYAKDALYGHQVVSELIKRGAWKSHLSGTLTPEEEEQFGETKNRVIDWMLVNNQSQTFKAFLEAGFKSVYAVVPLDKEGSRGQKTNLKNYDFLSEAVNFRSTEIVELIAPHKPYLEGINTHGSTPFLQACADNITRGQLFPQNNLLETLMKMGCNIEATNTISGENALMIAVMNNDLELCQTLLEKKIKVNFYNKYKQNILHVAAKKASKEILLKCLDLGFDINQVDAFGMTPLHHAADMAKLDHIDELIAHGARLDIKDRNGQTAESWARKSEYHVVANYLSERSLALQEREALASVLNERKNNRMNEPSEVDLNEDVIRDPASEMAKSHGNESEPHKEINATSSSTWSRLTI